MASVSSNKATTDNGDACVSGDSSSSSRRSNQTVSAPEWGGEAVSLKDFANQRKVPGFARVVKGSYMTIGTSRFSLHKQHHDIFIHSIKVGVKVLAHCLKRVESQPHRRGSGETLTRLCATEQRLTIPLTYQGWFELLSEDGKSARSITGVSELAKVFPSRCLVRENVKGYFTTGEAKLTFDKTKIVPAGEQLKLCGERAVLSPGEGVRVKLLHCEDTKGDNVYLNFDQKATFTPIAEEDDFTGVFNIRDIIRRFRLPLTVRLVHGVRPRVSESKFSGLIRLDWVYTEETAFVCPLEKNHVRLLPVPSDVSLQLVTATNQEELESSETFQSIQAKCARMVTNYNNTLHLVVTLPDSVLKKTQHRRSSSTRDSNVFSTPLMPGGDGPEDPGIRRRSKSREDLLMDEIDDIYCYVRDGGPVPPKPKFQYDSDEESYWEEPAYEPLDKFRARLTAMECGHPISFPDHYRPADPSQIQSLVKYGGDARGPIPLVAGDASGTGQPDLEKVVAAATSDVVPPTACVSHSPPPLPPRPSDLVASKPCPAQTSTEDTSMLVNTSRSSLAESDSHKPVLKRQASAPQIGSVSAQVLNHAEDKDSASAEDAKPSVLIPDSPKMPAPENAPEIPNTRTPRSDSESSLLVPVTSPEASTAVIKEQHTSTDAAKPGWKERLRHHTVLPDKDVNSFTSSGSGQPKGVPKMVKDFQDSDTSSKTKASLSGSSSGGERSARKRMQTLYL